ncbi:LysR substrate-binding domain-containing protein, partial [Zoogloea ramigera]|uniref:LysR substrate-binding domain-containing protein n=1 Tax=Zoogloea ramigera TaxID=350 RepID=UPI003FA2F0BD
MRYTLRQLEIFIAVARHESVSRAADALALSQSATSTALGELERQFDTQLFDRIGKALRLNEAGHVLLPHAVQLIEHAREIESMLARQTDFGPLQIGATLTVGNYLATLIAADFLRRHPSARVGLSVHNSATIMHQLLHYELDLGLIEGTCRHPDLLVEPWVEDGLVVVRAPGHPLAHGRPGMVAELATQDRILGEAGSGTSRA